MLLRCAGAFLFWASIGVAGAQAARIPLPALLHSLRQLGIDVLYSSDLIDSDALVPPAPPGSDALQHARTLLAERGLRLQRLGENSYAVVVESDPRGDSRAVLASGAQEPDTPIEEVSVYASRHALAIHPAEVKPLSRAQIGDLPGTQDDALRATRALPGIVSNGSARPYIRGSALNDVLVLFDGVTLADPFHLKNFQSLVSAFSSLAVDRVEVYSGGFPVRYGTRSGGVIDITPRSVSPGYEHAIGASLLTYDVASVGHGEAAPIDWLATLRHSTNDMVLKPVNADTGEPQFLDSVGRIRWRSSDHSAWTLGWLLLDDRIQLATDPANESAGARYRDEYGWVAYDRDLGDTLHSRSVFAITLTERARSGDLRIADVAEGRLDESRSSDLYEWRTELTYQPSPVLAWNFGIEATHANAELRYARTERFSDLIATSFGRAVDNSLNVSIDPNLFSYSLHAAVRRRREPIEAELGVRLDGERYSGNSWRRQLSPRLNVRYDFSRQWRAYASWGRFTQNQRLDEWRLEEAQDRPDAAQLSVHTILGAAYERSQAVRFTLEMYQKRWTRTSPYFDNMLDSLSLLPDLEPDRIRLSPQDSESVGIEFSARRALTPTLEGWFSYGWARVADEFAAGDTLRSWDQPHALNVGLAWNSGRRSASALLGWHQGWPRTPFAWTAAPSEETRDLVIGRRNSDRWDGFLTLDLRAGWAIPIRGSELATWVELTNATDRDNPCCVRFIPPRSVSGAAITEPTSWLPRILNAGFSWRLRKR